MTHKSHTYKRTAYRAWCAHEIYTSLSLCTSLRTMTKRSCDLPPETSQAAMSHGCQGLLDRCLKPQRPLLVRLRSLSLTASLARHQINQPRSPLCEGEAWHRTPSPASSPPNSQLGGSIEKAIYTQAASMAARADWERLSSLLI